MVLKKLKRKDENEFDCFLKEVKILNSLKHQNILRFLGVVYRGSTSDTEIDLETGSIFVSYF